MLLAGLSFMPIYYVGGSGCSSNRNKILDINYAFNSKGEKVFKFKENKYIGIITDEKIIALRY